MNTIRKTVTKNGLTLGTSLVTRYGSTLTAAQIAESSFVDEVAKTLGGLFTKRRAKNQVRSVLTLLGPTTSETVSFIREIHTGTGFALPTIGDLVKKLLSTVYGEQFSIEEIMGMEAADFKALYQVTRLGRCENTGTVEVYQDIPEILAERAGIWVEKMAQRIDIPAYKTTVLAYEGSGADDPAVSLEDILKYYVKYSASTPPLKNEISLKLLRLCIMIAGGFLFPVDTLKMTAIWVLMLSRMQDVVPPPDDFLKYGGVFLSLWITIAGHILKDGARDVVGTTVQLISEKTPDKAKECFYRFYEKVGGDPMNQKKYVAWHKTIAVLVNDDKVDMSSAMRMMSTFTIGRTFVRILTDRPELSLFLKDLSPVPGARTINDLLVLFRNYGDYKARTDKLLQRIEGLVEEDYSEDTLQKAFVVYRELLKLKIAFMPDFGFGQGGEISDPVNAPVDSDLVDTIAIYAFSLKHKNQGTIQQWLAFRSSLGTYIENNIDQSYFEYFGQPVVRPKSSVYTITYS